MKTFEQNQLKHYLGTGLKTTDGELIGITSWVGCCGVFKDETGERHIPISAIKPLLLPLSAITEQLPDGSIHIVELAKIASIVDWAYDEFYIEGEYIIAQCGEFHRFIFDGESFWFQNGYGNAEIAKHQLQLFEYLYQHHFWLGDQSLFETGEIIDKRSLK